MRIACWKPKAAHTHTLRICNTHCFSATTMVARTRLCYIIRTVHCMFVYGCSSIPVFAVCAVASSFLLRRKYAIYYYHFFYPYLAVLVVSRLLKVDNMIAAMFQHTFHSSDSCFTITIASAVFVFSYVFLTAALDSSVGKSETRGGIQRGFETHRHRGTKHGFLMTASDPSVIALLFIFCTTLRSSVSRQVPDTFSVSDGTLGEFWILAVTRWLMASF